MLDGTVAGLLVVTLVGVYSWDRTWNEMPVASGLDSPTLLSPASNAPTPPDATVQDSTADPSDGSEAQEQAAKKAMKPTEVVEGTGSKPPVAEVRAPGRDFVSRANMLERLPTAPEPEPPSLVARKVLTQKNLNQFGNPEGEGYGLAKANEFAGARMLVWSTEPEAHGNVFTDDNPLWAALKDLGFEIQMKRTRFEPRWLDEADQLWVFSGRSSGMDAAAYAAVVAFVQQGKGLYLAAENAPYFVEATELTRQLYQTSISGNYQGGNIVAVRGHGITLEDFRKLGKDADPEGKQAARDQGGKTNPQSRESKSRIDIINRSTHYAEEHPLLTDVNFIFEGITVSHIAPTTHLQTVLTANDKQILAAVSLDPGQRVVVDCGWTRYFFSREGRYVTDTAGTIRYAENIAAYLMGKDDKGQGGGQWQERKKRLEKYRDAASDDLVAAFQNTDPAERLAAVTMAARRRLSIPDALIELVRDAEPDVRKQARLALRGLAGGGVDYGPSEKAKQDECELSHQLWSGWLRRKKMLAKFETLTPDLVVAAMTSNDPEERWAAVSAALPRRLDIPDSLIGLLGDAEPEIRQLARQALAQLAGNADFGPAPNADQTATNAAILEWKRWRVLKKVPEVRNAKTEDLTAAMKVNSADHRWAAVIIVRQRKLRLGQSLINLLNDPERSIQQEARLALAQLAKGEDHGPNDAATPAQVAESVQQWTKWWQRESENTAAQKLVLARQLLKNNPEAARLRLSEIVEQFPGTAAAKEAKVLLIRQ